MVKIDEAIISCHNVKLMWFTFKFFNCIMALRYLGGNVILIYPATTKLDGAKFKFEII